MPDTKRSQSQPHLIQDIRDFTIIFNRKPTTEEVTDWASDFYSVPHPRKAWVKKIITLATNSVTSPQSLPNR